MQILSENKKAYFDYEILKKFDAGISLIGQEVKSLKTRGINLAGSYVILKNNREIFWTGANISPYQPKNILQDYNPKRDRKLLLLKTEINFLIGQIKQKGLTLVPLRLYIKNRKIKLEFGLCKGKKKYNKKEIIKKREIQREIERALKTKGDV